MAPRVGEYIPPGQSRQLLTSTLPQSTLYFPVGHSVHTDSESAPSTPEYDPCLQISHGYIEAPTAVLYHPASQFVQDDIP